MLFEAFNCDYFGPSNGHNLDHFSNILQNIRELDEPVLLHITSVKGKGYPQAEENPVYFHGVGCFDPETGTCTGPLSQVPSYTEVFGDTLTRLARDDESIVAVTAAMPEGTGLSAFAEAYPERFFDVGIAEQHGVTFAAGMATEGFRPVVAIYSTFLQRAYDQIIHDVCIEALPVVFALDRGGIVGEDGPTHHGLFDLSYLRSLPNMVVMAPKDENELARMLVTALNHQGPIALRYPRGRGLGVELDERPAPLPLGKAEILCEGEDLLILAIGSMVAVAVTAAEKLAADGVGATVINARFVKPLDTALISETARRIPRIITIEENALQGGFGSAVLEALSDSGVKVEKLRRLGIPDQFIEHGSQKLLRTKYGLDEETLITAAREILVD
jgi:1-deoxy-D-xylulose-5-phosphate synthase